MADETKPAARQQSKPEQPETQNVTEAGTPASPTSTKGVKPGSLPKKAAAEVEHPGVVAVNPPLLADEAEAHTDRVAMVSRDKNGNPDQSSDYEILVPEDASEQEKQAVQNLPADS